MSNLDEIHDSFKKELADIFAQSRRQIDKKMRIVNISCATGLLAGFGVIGAAAFYSHKEFKDAWQKTEEKYAPKIEITGACPTEFSAKNFIVPMKTSTGQTINLHLSCPDPWEPTPPAQRRKTASLPQLNR